MRHTKWNLMIWGFLVLGLLQPRVGIAQEVAWTFQAPTGGWIGITVDFTTRSVGAEEETLVVITEVVEGSPAEEAGIRVGDTITHMDGRLVSQKVFTALPGTLEPGDLVRIVVNREGQPREVLVEARDRPRSQIIVRPDAERMVVELQALSGNILRELDSLRLSIEGLHLDSSSGGLSVHVVRAPRMSEAEAEIGYRFELAELFLDTLSFGSDVFFMAPELAMPFQAMIVESRATSDLQEEILQLRKQLTTVRRQELSRRRELAASIQGPIEGILRKDAVILDLRAQEAELVAEQEELVAQLRKVSETEMQRHWMEVEERSQETLERARQFQSQAFEAERQEYANQARARDNYELMSRESRSPVLVGQNFMLGAQLAPLSPELAEYFPVDEGVFVVQVVEGTPAADARIQAGDIIVRVGGEEITSLSDLRIGLSAFERPLRIRVIRKGDPVEIIIRK